jgi:hypothetical protein
LCVCLFVCLLQSAMDEKSLYGTFTLHPWDREVDWMLEAKAAPCYVTVRICSGAWLLSDDDQSCTFSYIFLYLTHFRFSCQALTELPNFSQARKLSVNVLPFRQQLPYRYEGGVLSCYKTTFFSQLLTKFLIKSSSVQPVTEEYPKP